jgi:argininosuccinate lyase
MTEAAADGFTTATTLADALVRQGVPFRAAHHAVGALVGRAEEGNIRVLSDVPPAAFAGILASSDDETARRLASEPRVVETLLREATIAASLAGADVIGGTAPRRVQAAIAAARARLEREAGPVASPGTE